MKRNHKSKHVFLTTTRAFILIPQIKCGSAVAAEPAQRHVCVYVIPLTLEQVVCVYQSHFV
jgi:hypothetical protein